MHDLNRTQRDLLFAVAGNDGASGLELKAVLDDYYGTELSHGRIYPHLDTLAEESLVEKGRIDDRTNSYTLTARGRREIDARMEWQRSLAETYGDVEVAVDG